MKKITITLLLSLFVLCVNAQTEVFRIEKIYGDGITVGGKRIDKKRLKIKDNEAICFSNDNSGLVLRSKVHSRICITGKEMNNKKLSTVKEYLTYSDSRQKKRLKDIENQIYTRNTSVRPMPSPLSIKDTIFVLDTLYYELPLPDTIIYEGIYVIHIYHGEKEYIVPTGISGKSKLIAISRSEIQYEKGLYEMLIYIKDTQNDKNYPIVQGLWLDILMNE